MHFLDSNNFLTKILDLFNKNRIYIANTNTQADFQFIASNNYCRFTGFKINNAFAGNNGSSAIDINKDVINVLMPFNKIIWESILLPRSKNIKIYGLDKFINSLLSFTELSTYIKNVTEYNIIYNYIINIWADKYYYPCKKEWFDFSNVNDSKIKSNLLLKRLINTHNPLLLKLKYNYYYDDYYSHFLKV